MIWKKSINVRIIENTKVDTPKTTHQSWWRVFDGSKLLPKVTNTIKKQISTQIASRLVQESSRISQIKEKFLTNYENPKLENRRSKADSRN